MGGTMSTSSRTTEALLETISNELALLRSGPNRAPRTVSGADGHCFWVLRVSGSASPVDAEEAVERIFHEAERRSVDRTCI